MMRHGALAAFLLVAACADSPTLGVMPEGHPLEVAITAASDEIGMHRANLAASTSMAMLANEIQRHDGMTPILYREIGTRVGDMGGCASPGAAAELASLVRGLKATELGRDEAIQGMTALGQARDIADAYASGIGENLERIETLAGGQASCF